MSAEASLSELILTLVGSPLISDKTTGDRRGDDFRVLDVFGAVD
jgi:hypothetical protein